MLVRPEDDEDEASVEVALLCAFEDVWEADEVCPLEEFCVVNEEDCVTNGLVVVDVADPTGVKSANPV